MLQAANAHLQDQLYATRQQLMQQQQQPNTINPHALKKRLEDVAKALLTYRVIHRNLLFSVYISLYLSGGMLKHSVHSCLVLVSVYTFSG